jgi:hypothetical protein
MQRAPDSDHHNDTTDSLLFLQASPHAVRHQHLQAAKPGAASAQLLPPGKPPAPRLLPPAAAAVAPVPVPGLGAAPAPGLLPAPPPAAAPASAGRQLLLPAPAV